MTSLLITEVNSNATGGDFFELYNYGSTDIDLSGWKWNDSQATFGGTTAVTFASGTTLAAGKVLVVFQGASTGVAAFKTAWGLGSGVTVYANAAAGPGLGKGDAVVVFDASGNVVASFNYNDTAANGIGSATRTDGGAIAATDNHAGTSMGAATDVVSAVWDQTSSVTAPKYTYAVTGTNGALAESTGATAGVGSPGVTISPSLNYSSKTLAESSGNDGSVPTVLTLTLSSETFTGSNGDDLIAGGKASVNHLPAGLTAVLTRTSATTATLTLTGNASAHANANDVSNLTISLADSAFAGGNAAAVSGASTSNLVVDFIEPSLTYSTTTLNEARALDGSVTGKIVITLVGGSGSFAGSNGDSLLSGDTTVSNVPAGLTAHLVRTSATTAELSFTGSATSHANADDLSNLGLHFGDSALVGISAAGVTGATRSDLHIDFADLGVVNSTQTYTPNAGTSVGSSDTSTAQALDANWMVVGDNEANVLRVYSREGGAAVAEWSYAAINPLLASAQGDIEASVRIGDTIYFTGSHSNKSAGAEADNREIIFAVSVSGTGASTQFTMLNNYTGLEAALVSWDSSNAHGLGANYFGLAADSANGVAPEGVNGFNIEGLTASADGTYLMFGLRAPLSGSVSHDQAVLITVRTDSIFSGTPVFGTPVELDLGGRGIREIKEASDGSGYLILAGPAGGASAEVTNDFRLYRWDGSSSHPTELDTALDGLLTGTDGSFETIVDVVNTNSGTLVQLLQDDGDTLWSGQTTISKDLPASLQKYEGNWVLLGNAVTDTTGPVLASSSPTDNGQQVQVGADLVLRFDEGVRAGTGSFVIKNAADGSVVETIAANSSQVSVAYNVVSINPSSDLAYGGSYYVETSGTAVVDHSGNGWTGISDASTLNFNTAQQPTTLAVGDLLFVAANADDTDAFAFVLLKGVTAGTTVGFTDRNDNASTGLPTSGEGAYLWTADQNYAAGTVVTVQPGVVSGNPLVDKGSMQGNGSGLSSTAETIYAFQGSIAGLGDGSSGAITVDHLLASINFGGAAAGDVPASIASSSISLSLDDNKYTGPLDTSDLGQLAAWIMNSANWSGSDTASFALTDGSLLPGAPAPTLTNASANGSTVVLTFSEALDAAHAPAASDFVLTGAGGAYTLTPSAISVLGNQVTLTLDTPLHHNAVVTVGYTDAHPASDDSNALQDSAGNDAASFSGVAVTNNTANSAPTGSVSVVGTAIQGQTLTATNTLADLDGLGAISYQWLADGVAISGATASTLVLGAAQTGKAVSVSASYTDGYGTHESVSSASVTPVSASVLENTKAVTTVSVSDTLLGSAPKYTLSGADAALFKISSKGVLTFAAAPDYEVPTDANHDGHYSVSVTLTNSKTHYVVTQNLLVDVAFAEIDGTSGADILKGTKGWDTLDGQTGDDKLTGGDGLDTFIISAGTDTITDFNALGKSATGQEVLVVAQSASVTATVKTVWTATSASSNSGDATLLTSGLAVNLSGITSGDGWIVHNTGKATTLTGSQFDDQLTGASGNDSLLGGAGDDTLSGGKGNDVLTGGADADIFVFGGDVKTDHIIDFVSGTDHIELDHTLFKALSVGQLTDAQWAQGTVATTTSQHLIYDSTSGNLWYDADGSGKTKVVLIGVLDNHALLQASDFLVV